MTKVIQMIPYSKEGSERVQLNVDGVPYATYELFSGETADKISDKAYLELRKVLYAYASKEVYHK